jgi:transmembrane sensor
MSKSQPKTNATTISDEVLDQAFHWAMLLGDTEVSVDVIQAFEHWLQQQPSHQVAWQRLQIIEQEFMPAKAVATQGSAVLNSLNSKRSSKRSGKVASLLSVTLLVGLSLFYSTEQWRYDYVTAKGEQQQFILPGGAKVRLASNTRVDVEHTSKGIFLHLNRGKLLVNSRAATLNNKPQVITDFGRFKPIGTRFVVSKLAKSSELAVTEGQVNITAGQASKNAVAGERWRVVLTNNDNDTNNNVTENTTADNPRYSINKQMANGLTPDAWVDNVIEANNARLGDVLAILAQHHQGWLRYSNEVAALRVTGVFRLDDTDIALNSIQNSLPIKVEKTTNWWLKLTIKK